MHILYCCDSAGIWLKCLSIGLHASVQDWWRYHEAELPAHAFLASLLASWLGCSAPWVCPTYVQLSIVRCEQVKTVRSPLLTTVGVSARTLPDYFYRRWPQLLVYTKLPPCRSDTNSLHTPMTTLNEPGQIEGLQVQEGPLVTEQNGPISDDSTSQRHRPNAAPNPKRRRVIRACDECRRGKIKCDGKQPCTHCALHSYGRSLFASLLYHTPAPVAN